MNTTEKLITHSIDSAPAWPGDCFDMDSPYDVQHVGKLVPEQLEEKGPRRHCVVQVPDQNDRLSIVRFTPMYSGENTVSINYGRRGSRSAKGLITSAEQAAEIHEKHLKYLGKVGLRPWLTSIDPGERLSTDGTSGVFTLQPLLPEEATNLSSISIPHHKFFKYSRQLGKSVGKYKSWAERQSTPVRLWDINGVHQYSILPDGELVLHDIEPLYESI